VKTFAEAARSLRALRREIMAANGWSLRDFSVAVDDELFSRRIK
jgi:hypothetical protein